jgi:hypothetical protein
MLEAVLKRTNLLELGSRARECKWILGLERRRLNAPDYKTLTNLEARCSLVESQKEFEFPPADLRDTLVVV